MAAAQTTLGIDLEGLVARARFDREVVGGTYSTACYITDSWPSLLYQAYKYLDAPKAALLANTNLGGENAHRCAVLGGIIWDAGERSMNGLVNYGNIQPSSQK